ncbi:outer membrane protein assembly factor BamB family protein [Kitasatospora sp. NPDC004240]
MAQDPLGPDQQQAWYPQQQYDEQYDGRYGDGHAQQGGYRQPGSYDQYGQQQHGQQQYGGQYAQQPYQQGQYGQYQPYPQAGEQYGGQYGQQQWETGPAGPTGYADGAHQQPYWPSGQPDQEQQYTPYVVRQPAPAEQLYAPADAEYSADGYVVAGAPVRPEPEPEPVPDPVPVAPAGAAARREGEARSGLAAKARAAAEAVVSAEHAPSRRTLAVRAGAGVAALGVLIAAGLTVGGEGGATSGTEAGGGSAKFNVAHAKAWAAQPAEALPPGADDTLVGGWLLESAVVRADSTGVRAYDLADGKPVWAVEPPAPGAVPCGLSPSVGPSGLGAALFRPQADPKAPCSLVVAVDTKTGKTAWTKPLSETKGGYSARVGVTEDKVIAVGDDHVVAWAAADGKDIWQYTGQGKFCTLSGGVSGKTVMVASTCADSTPADQAVSLHVADGTVAWWRGLNNQPKTVTVLSAEPAVVLTTGEKPGDDRVFAWGTTGDPAAEIPVGTEDGTRLDVAHGSFSATPGVFFQERTMVTTLAPPGGNGPLSVTGYDLDSGKQRWRTAVGEKGGVRAVGLDGAGLLLAADERTEQPAHLSRIALADGKETVGGNFPQGTGSLLLAGRVLTGGGKVVAIPVHSANFGIAAAFQAQG